MKKISFGIFVLVTAAGAAIAGTVQFPYADSLTSRYATNEAVNVNAFTQAAEVPVPATSAGAMPSTENIAVITSSVTSFTAADADDWSDEASAIGNIQASLSMKYVDTTSEALTWMGYTTTGWQALSGVDATEGAWQIKIEIDYSLQTKAVRYSVKSSGDTYTVLTNSAGVAWLPLGGSSTVVNGISLFGYGTVATVDGSCAARPFEGTVKTSETYNMQYADLKVIVAATNVWGDTVKVTLKKNGTAVEGAVKSGTVAADGTCAFVADFSDLTTVGDDYTYDLEFLKGGSDGTVIETQATKGSVKLYSEIDWFGFKDGEFANATTNGIYIDTAKQTFSSDDDEVIGTVTPTETSDDGAQTTVETEVIVAGVSSMSELPTEVNQQFAVSLATVTDGEETVRKWCTRVGSGDWTASAASIATTNGTYLVKVTFDYRDGKKTGTCWVKPDDDSSEYAILISDFALGTATKLAGTSVLGGDIGYMNASRKTVEAAPVVADEEKKEISISSNANVELKDLIAGSSYTVTNTGSSVSHLSWTDGNSKYAKVNATTGKLEVKSGTPANGMDSFESYVLNLDADTATSKPIVKSEQISDASKIKFTLPDLSPKNETVTGVAVSYQLEEFSDPMATTAEKTTDFDDDGSATVALPASGAKFYKVKINFAK